MDDCTYRRRVSRQRSHGEGDLTSCWPGHLTNEQYLLAFIRSIHTNEPLPEIYVLYVLISNEMVHPNTTDAV